VILLFNRSASAPACFPAGFPPQYNTRGRRGAVHAADGRYACADGNCSERFAQQLRIGRSFAFKFVRCCQIYFIGTPSAASASGCPEQLPRMTTKAPPGLRAKAVPR